MQTIYINYNNEDLDISCYASNVRLLERKFLTIAQLEERRTVTVVEILRSPVRSGLVRFWASNHHCVLVFPFAGLFSSLNVSPLNARLFPPLLAAVSRGKLVRAFRGHAYVLP